MSRGPCRISDRGQRRKCGRGAEIWNGSTWSIQQTAQVQGAGATSTTIDGGSLGTTVTFTGNSSILTGFTITGGMNAQYDGGGILVNGGSHLFPPRFPISLRPD